jgi:hypothetical protein
MSSERDDRGRDSRAPLRVTVPRFVTDEEIGAGDALKRLTASAGIRPCGGCARRAERLNRSLAIGPRSRSR